jgi:hypothetical protein
MRNPTSNKAVTPHVHTAGGYCEKCVQRPSKDVDPSKDPVVRRANATLDRAVQAEEEARARWEKTEAQARVLRNRATSSGVTVINPQTSMMAAAGVTAAMRAEINAAEAEAQLAWQQFRTASADALAARQAQREATLAATRRG